MNTTPAVVMLTDALVSQDFKMSAEAAESLACGLIRAAAKCGYAGMHIYVHSVPDMPKDERNALIRRDFKGSNLREVCLKYGVSKTTVYRVCHR